jgi:hypothetical protein
MMLLTTRLGLHISQTCMHKHTHRHIHIHTYIHIRTDGCVYVCMPFFVIYFICTETVYMYIGFEVLTTASMKMDVFWVVAPCSLVEVYQCFRGTRCLHHQDDAHHPDDGGSKYL